MCVRVHVCVYVCVYVCVCVCMHVYILVLKSSHTANPFLYVLLQHDPNPWQVDPQRRHGEALRQVLQDGSTQARSVRGTDLDTYISRPLTDTHCLIHQCQLVLMNALNSTRTRHFQGWSS